MKTHYDINGGAAQLVLLFLSIMGLQIAAAQMCGQAVDNTLCGDGLCCSQYGYCGTSLDYCGAGCQSQCVLGEAISGSPPVESTSGLNNTVNATLFEALFPNRNPFYTYNSFLLAGNAFPEFGTQGDNDCRMREIAAFAAHVQQETAGLVYIREINQTNSYCDATTVQYPCAANQSYFGRGPLQLSWNFNYGPASEALGADLLEMPDQVATNPVLAFESSLWFWTQTRGTIPSIHDVLTGNYKPTRTDLQNGRKPGFGLTILIINGGLECGRVTPQATNRVDYFKQFAAQLGVDPGCYLTCDKMTPYGS